MKFKYLLKTSVLSFSLVALTSCLGDLDQEPIDPDSFTEIDVFETVESSKGAFAKLYNAIAINGQSGWGYPTDGDFDLDVPDGGASQYTRLMFNLQTLTTDEGINGWGDGTLRAYSETNWSSDNEYNKMFYDRLAQSVIYCGEFIKNVAKFEGDSEIAAMVAEARFLRAYHYYNIMDAYGMAPIQLEISNEMPVQNTREEIFDFVESELIDLKEILPSSNEYGRVDRVAALALLSRLYLNSESLTGVDRYQDAVNYSEQTIASSYALHDNYQELFLSDNDRNGAERENIFVISYDINTTTAGGTSFYIHANLGGTIDAYNTYGSNAAWGGNRALPTLVEKFEASSFDGDGFPTSWNDQRAIFHTDGQ